MNFDLDLPMWLRWEEASDRWPQRDRRVKNTSKNHAHTLCTARSCILKHTHTNHISTGALHWSERLLDGMFLEGISFSSLALSKCHHALAECVLIHCWVHQNTEIYNYRESKLSGWVWVFWQIVADVGSLVNFHVHIYIYTVYGWKNMCVCVAW